MAKKRLDEHFTFRLRAPSTDYTFGTPWRADSSDAFWEYQGLSFVAECLMPDRLKGGEARVTLMGDRERMDMTLRTGRGWKPEAIGWMVATKRRFELTAVLPMDACWQIGAAMSAGSVVYMTLSGPALFRGRTNPTSISFHGPDYDPMEG